MAESKEGYSDRRAHHLAAGSPQDQTVTAFITAVNAHNLTNVLNTFTNNQPAVGITSASASPIFKGNNDITNLFTQLFVKSFPDLALTETGMTRLYSPSGFSPPTIGLEGSLTGTYSQPWFPKIKGTKDAISHYSKPLSDIPVQQTPAGATVPTYCVFIFADAQHPNSISTLSMFLDRYTFLPQLLATADP